ncbi:MAG: PDDEXK nuclease domain-containing protein [Candidatus Binatia bacterium]
MNERSKTSQPSLPTGYAPLLVDLKARVRAAQVRAVLSVNRELVSLYWHIGREILRCQREEGWGAKVVERLAKDLRLEFPEMHGFSRANLLSMRAFADVYPNDAIVQQLVGQLPWGHNVLLLTKVKNTDQRLWYAQQALEHGWSRAVLTVQIETGAHARSGKALTNFKQTLTPPQSDLAQQVLKDPYVFDFLTLSVEARERELEQRLVDHVQKFLLELGVGFAFVGRQAHLEVGKEDYYLDLLFYHLKLRCYVVIDLKMEPFKPEFAGKMNFYLSAVDDRMRGPQDQPTIGLLLCRDKNRITVEYALRNMAKPIGVAQWQTRLVEALPKKLKGALPSVKDLEKELT